MKNLEKIIKDVYSKYKGIVYEGVDFSKVNLELVIDDSVGSPTVSQHNMKTGKLYFNLHYIQETLSAFNYDAETYITILLFQEFAQIIFKNEHGYGCREEVQSLMIDTICRNDLMNDLFSQYITIPYIGVECLCYMISLEMCIKFTDLDKDKTVDVIKSILSNTINNHLINILEADFTLVTGQSVSTFDYNDNTNLENEQRVPVRFIK